MEVADEELTREIQRRLHSLLAPLYNHPTYFPGGQPVSFTRSHLTQDLHTNDYYVCEKSDGVRYLLYFAQPPGGIAAFLIDRNWRVLVFPGFGMMTRDLNPGALLEDTVIDGELIEATGTFLMFDCLVANGQPVWRLELPERLAKLQNHVMFPYQHMLKSIEGYASDAPFKLKLKTQYKSYGIAELLDQVIPNQEHPNDGLIFTPVKEPYRAGTWPSLLKWKPAEWNTVDFEVRAMTGDAPPGDTPPGDTPSDAVALFVNRHGKPDFYTTSADPNLPQHIGHIVECRLHNHVWTFMRERHDKQNPNDRSVAEKVIASIKDNVTRDDLVKALDGIRTNWKARESGDPIVVPRVEPPITPQTNTMSAQKTKLEWKSFEEYDDHVNGDHSNNASESDTKKLRSERERDGEKASEAPLEYNI